MVFKFKNRRSKETEKVLKIFYGKMSVDFVIKAYLNVLDVDEVVTRAKFVNG